ncbi:MarR family transcriptional regulator [Eubacteriaceae bacterium ES3]|nr:MarR family transcriptional regulator [Eubacteriaceae bacterium ES3]
MKKEKKAKKSAKEKKSPDKESRKKKIAASKKSEPVHKSDTAIQTSQANQEMEAKSGAEVAPSELLILMKKAAESYQNIITAPLDFLINDQDTELFPSELKTLEIIGEMSGINLTQLSIELDISKSAVSKCTGKMLEKDLINKTPSPTNVRQVQFSLTESGKLIFDQYQDLQNNLFKPLYKSFESLNPDDNLKLQSFLESIAENLTEIEAGLTTVS